MIFDAIIAAMTNCNDLPNIDDAVYCVIREHPQPPNNNDWCEWQKQLMKGAGAEIDPNWYCRKE